MAVREREAQAGRLGVGGRRLWWAVGALAALVLVAGVAAAARATATSLPPGTTTAGEPVRTPAEAAELARTLNRRLLELPVELSTAAGTTTVPAGRLGAVLDTAAIHEAALASTGTDAWIDRFTGGGRVTLPVDVTVEAVDLADVVEAVSTDPVDGDVTITPDGVDVTQPVQGVDVTAEQVRDAVTPVLTGLAETPAAEWPDRLQIPVDATEIPPWIERASIDTVLAEIERITTTPVTVTASIVPEDGQTVDSQGVPPREEAMLELPGAALRDLLAVNADRDAPAGQRLRVVPDVTEPPPALVEFVADAAVPPVLDIEVVNRSPVPPRNPPGGPPATGPGGPADQPRLADTSGITGDLVARVVTPGLDPDPVATAESIISAAAEGQATVSVQGTPVDEGDPTLLGIVEPVSTYTTFYTAGESRVTNIHRIAEIVDGALIPPGGNYDVNHAVGERTTEKGFVPAGAILEGEFVTDVGGGVSQFGTTFFNAMWYSGVDIITHTPHSYWFERYPAGREATIDYPGVNLELNNNTPYWILVDTEVTADSVTVTFWSTRHFEVSESIGPREPVAGADFRITIERLATAPALPELGVDAVNDDDRFTHTYGNPP